MATFQELTNLMATGTRETLLRKVEWATLIKAQTLIDGANPSAAELNWANNALMDTENVALRLLKYVIAANSSATTSQITNATDTTIQTNVDAAVDVLIAGGLI